MPMPRRVFHCFPLLPEELRCAIWEACLPRRVVEIDVPVQNVAGTYCESRTTSVVNAQPPLISLVCRESRRVALRSGWPLRSHMKLAPDFEDWGAWNILLDQWASPATDFVHTHFDDGYDDLTYPHWGPADVWTYLKNAASMTRGASVTHEVIYPFHQPSNIFSYVKFFERLEPLKKYQVCLKIINVHLSPEQGVETDLFGITGEEVVKCVDAYHIEKYKALGALVAQGDDEAKQAFELLGQSDFKSQVEKWEERVTKMWLFAKWTRAIDYPRPPQRTHIVYPSGLVMPRAGLGTVWTTSLDSDAIYTLGYKAVRHPDYYSIVEDNKWVQDVTKDRPSIRPVIMFRLCPLNCWAKARPEPQPPYEFTTSFPEPMARLLDRNF